LAKFAETKVPNGVVVAFSQFLNDPIFTKLVQAFVDDGVIESTES
jgi:hypothetical protein